MFFLLGELPVSLFSRREGGHCTFPLELIRGEFWEKITLSWTPLYQRWKPQISLICSWCWIWSSNLWLYFSFKIYFFFYLQPWHWVQNKHVWLIYKCIWLIIKFINLNYQKFSQKWYVLTFKSNADFIIL